MSDLSFKVAKRRAQPITFDLEGDDHVYTFTPPKQAGTAMPLIKSDMDIKSDAFGLAAARSTFKWLDDGLSDEDREHIEARLRDPKDDLDFDTLGEVVEALMERVTGKPTGS